MSSGALVYVVDDDPVARDGVADLIRSAGLTAKAFGSGEEFLAAPRPQVPSCLVLDVVLPGVNGLEVQEELAKSDAQLPVVFLTGYADIPMTVRAVKAGAAHFLTKPFDAEELLNTVQRCVAYCGEKIRHSDIAMAMSMLGEELTADASYHPPALRVIVEGQPPSLHPILCSEIYKIAAEALRNAFLHAQARQVEVEIRYDNEQLRLRVRDDGRGIDPKVLASDGHKAHSGLHGMRERATVLSAKLTLWSAVDGGTEVELQVPACMAYAASQQRPLLARRFIRSAED